VQDVTAGRYFFHAIEIDGGRWACRWGRTEYDTHALLHPAIDHLTALAGEHRPSQVLVHYLDGRTQRVAAFDPT
jgi:hypothetical protein